MSKLRILFMGASRLVGLLERFFNAAKAEAITLEMYSLEDNAPWHAVGVSGLCNIVSAPRFNDKSFSYFLKSFVDNEGISVVIPNIDSATVALAQLKDDLEEKGVFAVVSHLRLCKNMLDKVEAEKFFLENNLNVPYGIKLPLLAKPRFGASSRGHILFKTMEEYKYWQNLNDKDDFLIQPLMNGTEYSIDAYVNRAGGIQGIVSRVRVVVSGGEVMVTRTEHNQRVEELAKQVLSIPAWQGPLVVQIIDTGEDAYLIECNPRFGSGVTCSIEAGLDAPRWILRETLGRPLPKETLAWKTGLCMTRYRKDCFIWLSS